MYVHFRTDVRTVINPLLTILFDLFLIGSALIITAGMVGEAIARREPHVGGERRPRRAPVSPAAPRRRATMHRFPDRRRAA